MTSRGAPHPLSFFGDLVWLDGRPLVTTIEPYRRATFSSALYTFDAAGIPQHNLVLCGRAKKNWKTTDLILAGLYRFLAWPSDKGNDSYILANDEGQASDDLDLAKKLVAVNPVLGREVTVRSKELVRRDGNGVFKVLPAQNALGEHGKTFLFCGFDEIHGYRNHDLFEALAPDPSRHDCLVWVTSYAGIRHAPGIPLYDFMRAGRAGDDPRMYFSWYAADYGTDPDFARDDLSPEARANPSLASWGNDGYLAQQRQRLPTHRYRRLHLNLPGAPDGAAFSGEHVIAAIVPGRKYLAPERGRQYFGFVDMSGGSNDSAVLGIAHRDKAGPVVLDLLVSQTGAPPFDPRAAVRKFAAALREYGLATVTGDAYGGNTFRIDFEAEGVRYIVSERSTSEIYQKLEPLLNSYKVELLDIGELQEQLLTLVWRGAKIDHLPGDHDDHACAASGALALAAGEEEDSQLAIYMALAATTSAQAQAEYEKWKGVPLPEVGCALVDPAEGVAPPAAPEPPPQPMQRPAPTNLVIGPQNRAQQFNMGACGGIGYDSLTLAQLRRK